MFKFCFLKENFFKNHFSWFLFRIFLWVISFCILIFLIYWDISSKISFTLSSDNFRSPPTVFSYGIELQNLKEERVPLNIVLQDEGELLKVPNNHILWIKMRIPDERSKIIISPQLKLSGCLPERLTLILPEKEIILFPIQELENTDYFSCQGNNLCLGSIETIIPFEERKRGGEYSVGLKLEGDSEKVFVLLEKVQFDLIQSPFNLKVFLRSKLPVIF